MTHETKKRVKKEAFAEMRRSALTCMMSTTGLDIEDTWEGVMDAIVMTKLRGSTDEFAGVLLSAMKWMHAYCEQWTCEKVHAAESLLEHEKDAEHEEALASKRA